MVGAPLLYEGKAKQLYETEDPYVVRVVYKDDATAFNGEKEAELAGKGALNNAITSVIFAKLRELGVKSHFVEKISAAEQLVKKVEVIPLEVIVRNTIAGSLARRLGMVEGIQLNRPVLEFCYKNDELGDPLVNEDHIGVLQVCSSERLEQVKTEARLVNNHLSRMFKDAGIQLVDLKLEFGVTANGAVLLADEISPDTCRLWELGTHEKFDKDLFRHDLGDVTAAYREILRRLEGATCV